MPKHKQFFIFSDMIFTNEKYKQRIKLIENIELEF
jgi:hypothetical protein